VDAGELEEGELAQVLVGARDLLRVRQPDDVLEDLDRALVVALGVEDEPVQEPRAGEDVALRRRRRVLPALRVARRRRRDGGRGAHFATSRRASAQAASPRRRGRRP